MNPMKTNACKSLVVLIFLAGTLVGCAGSVSDPEGRLGPLGIDPETGLPILPGSEPKDPGRVYQGFGGSVLGGDRLAGVPGEDTYRVKPYTSLAGEFTRTLGKVPALLPSFATTFSSSPDRWYIEPAADAVSLFSAYRAAFQGCLDFTATAAAYAAAPTAATASQECGTMSMKFWSRAASAEEISICVDVATVQTQKDTNPRRKWAYTCAAMLSSSGFLTF